MTNPKPCLLKCLCMCGNSRAGHVREMHRPNDFCPRQDGHAPGCPNAAPKASDAPKRCPECKHRPHGTVCFNGESDGDCGCEYGKPAPAPEPKQGSEEPDFGMADEWAADPMPEDGSDWLDSIVHNAARAYLALRADLAAAREEIAKAEVRIERWHGEAEDWEEKYIAEKARADRAEERVKELEDRIAQFAVLPGGHFARNSERYSNAREWLEREGAAILAARAHKEGGSRG